MENRTTHGRATGVHGRAPQAESAGFGTATARPAVPVRTATRVPHARPCVGAQAAVRGGTAVPAACSRDNAVFRPFMCFSFGDFGTSP